MKLGLPLATVYALHLSYFLGILGAYGTRERFCGVVMWWSVQFRLGQRRVVGLVDLFDNYNNLSLKFRLTKFRVPITGRCSPAV